MTRSAGGKFDLSASPIHLLHRAQQFASDKFMTELDGEAITQRQFAVLNAVAMKEGSTQTDLVHATGIDRSTLAELVSRMARRKLVARKRATNDARANVVSLTAEGRALLRTTLPRVARADEAILDVVPKARRAAFVETLKRISQTLDDPVAEPAPAAPAPKPAPAKVAAVVEKKKKPKKAKAAAPKAEKKSKPAKKEKKKSGKKAKK